MALNRLKPCLIECDMMLKHRTSVSLNAKLTIEFLKLLMYQKGQIPVPYQQLKTYISSVEKEVVKYEEEKSNLVKLKPKERLTLTQLYRKRVKFLKLAKKFENDFNSLTEEIDSAFELNCQQIAIIVGTSVFNAKEIIALDWTNASSNPDDSLDSFEASKSAKANQASLFRYVITSEELAPFLSPVRPSSLHVVCQTIRPPKGALPRLNFKFPLRARRVTLRMLSNESLGTPEKLDALTTAMQKPLIITDLNRPVIRRLLFDSPLVNQRSVRISDDDCDISGVASLDDEDDCFSLNSDDNLGRDEAPLCWFQLNSCLNGFADDSLFR